MIWILIIAAAVGILYYVKKGRSFSEQSSSSTKGIESQYPCNTILKGNQSSIGSTTSGSNTFPVVPSDAMEAIACLASLFEEIDSRLSYLHMPGEIHLDISQVKGSNVARLFVWYSKDYDGLGEWTSGNYTLSSGFSVSDNTIEYRSQSITGFRQNMNRILSVILAYLPNAKLDHDNNPTGYSDYTKEYFAHGVYHL